MRKEQEQEHIQDNMMDNDQDIPSEKEIPVSENEETDESSDVETGRMEELEKELEDMRNKYLRLVAEFDNYRKRTSRERQELIQTADKDVITSLLDVLDDCDRATDQMETTDDIAIVKEGALLIFNKLRKVLQARGVKEMNSLHTDFDAELHDAIAEVPAPSKDLQGKVLDNIQKGYYLNDKIIRHAKVVVGK